MVSRPLYFKITMKRFILSFLALLSGLLAIYRPFLPAFYVHADGETAVYACIRSDDVYLYQKENSSSGMFILPYTYYVKILAEGIDYCYVQYQTDGASYKAVYGYCKTAELTFVDYIPKNPYLSYTVQATYYLDGAASSFVTDSILSSVTLSYAYYGDYTVGSSVYHYVILDGKTGYLPKTAELSYELNTEYEQNLPQQNETPSPSSTTESELPIAQIVLFALLGLLAVGFVYYLLRPRQPQPQSSTADEFGFSKDELP